MLDNQQAVVIGERDGISGPAIAKCLEAVGAEVAFVDTACFV
jgi:glycine reductase